MINMTMKSERHLKKLLNNREDLDRAISSIGLAVSGSGRCHWRRCIEYILGE